MDVEAELQNSFRRFKISHAYKEHLCSVVVHNSLSEVGLMQMQQFNDNVANNDNTNNSHDENIE